MGQVRKIKAGLVKISVNDFVGEDGNIFFDVDDGIMRLSDGLTPGGVPLSSGGAEGGASTFRQLLDTPSSFTGQGGNFLKVNPQGSAIEFVDVTLFDGDYNSLTNKPIIPDAFDPSSIDQSLLPDTDIAYDLGSATNKWRDLYLSGNTIFLGNARIRNVDGTVELPLNAKVNGKRIPLDVSDLDDVNGLLNGSGGGVTSYNELTDLPTLFSGSYTDLTNKPTIPTDLSDLTDNTNLLAGAGGDGSYTLPIATSNTLGGIKIGTGLSINGSGVVSVTVDTFSGNYNDLTNKPTLFDGQYASLTGLPDLTVYQLAVNAFSGSYTDLTDTPTLFDGAYTSLTGVPDLTVYQLAANAFSGDYNDLINTPTIPTVPTTISSFTNDSGYITGYTVTQADVTQHQSALSITESQISDLGSYLTSVAFTDLTSKPTTLDGYGITDAFDGNYNSLINLPTLFSGSYTDLINKPIIPVDINELTDVDSLLASTFDGSFTSLTDVPTTLAEYGIDIEVNTAINTAVNDVLDGAPELLDSLNELAAAVGDDPNFVTTINSAISLKANSADLSIVATTNNYKDLDDLPIIPADVTELNDALKSIIPNVEAEIFAMTVMIG